MELEVEWESAVVFAVVVTTSHTWGVDESGGSGGGDGGGFTRTVEGMGPAPFIAALVVVELPMDSVCHAKEDVRGGMTGCATLISITTEFSTVPLRPV